MVYDSQEFFALSGSTPALSYNVTLDAFAPGLAFLVDGVAAGYWYQFGIAYGFGPYSGFSALVDNWYPGEIWSPASFSRLSGPVRSGDSVSLGLTVGNGTVVARAYDWDTGATFTAATPAYGSSFEGSMDNYFSGPMTEWSHPVDGACELPVVYSGHFGPGTLTVDASALGGGSMRFNGSAPAVLDVNGAEAAANSTEFMTGFGDVG